MSTKHVFNDSDGLVLKALRGAVALNPDLRIHAPSKSVYARTRSHARVALVSGGGAGHEPAHAGYTGRGMLAASVSGDIFASPSASQVLACIRLAFAAQDTSEALLIVNNYTGDRLNFGLAAERAHGLSLPSETSSESTQRSRVRVETVVVADDVSLLDRPSLVGARGLAGNILVCKILGAAAETGFSLDDLKKLGDVVVSNLASIGVGLAHCHVPGRKESSDAGIIADGMCELGLGLHNEPGARRMELGSAKVLVGKMLEQILCSTIRSTNGLEEERRSVQTADGLNGGDDVSYTSTTWAVRKPQRKYRLPLESGQLITFAESQDIRPARVLLSSFMTSLNAPGFSLSILNLSSICRSLASTASSGEDTAISIGTLLSFIDAPTDATAWSSVLSDWPTPGNHRDRIAEAEEANLLLDAIPVKRMDRLPVSPELKGVGDIKEWTLNVDAKRVESGIRSACNAVLAAENELTRLDTIVGDGDCGETFSSGARAVLQALDGGQLDVSGLTPNELMAALSELLLDSMGGTSGALFGLYFTALSNALSSHISANLPPSGEDKLGMSLETAPLAALEALSAYTPARPGDRTLVDALSPFCHALASGEGLEAAVKDARVGAESTRGMRARLGRATYVDNGSGGENADSERLSESTLPPDPGAWGVAALLEGFVQGQDKGNLK